MNEQDQLELLDSLRRIADSLGAIALSLHDQNWTCGCGHVNGPTLQWCARCARKPGEQH